MSQAQILRFAKGSGWGADIDGDQQRRRGGLSERSRCVGAIDFGNRSRNMNDRIEAAVAQEDSRATAAGVFARPNVIPEDGEFSRRENRRAAAAEDGLSVSTLETRAHQICARSESRKPAASPPRPRAGQDAGRAAPAFVPPLHDRERGRRARARRPRRARRGRSRNARRRGSGDFSWT